MADPDRPGVAARPAGRHFHQQGSQRDVDTTFRHAADQHARHVGRHLPRPLQPFAARAPPRSRPAGHVSDSRHGRPAFQHQAPDEGDERRRREIPAQTGHGLHQQLQGRGLARPQCGSLRQPLTADARNLRGIRQAMPARRRRRLRRAAAALLRTAGPRQQPAPALPEPVQIHPGRRVPGHQPPAVPVAETTGGARELHLRRRRRRPVNLRLPRCPRRQHARSRTRFQRAKHRQAGTELPLAQQHPRRRQRHHHAQPQPTRKEPVDVGRQGRTDPLLSGL